MAMTYDEARKIAENRKYGVTGNSDNIDEGYIKAIQDDTMQKYSQKLIDSAPKPSNNNGGGNSGGGGFSFNYNPLSTKDAYKRAEGVISPQMQQLKNNLILSMSKQRTNDVTGLAARGQATGGQRQLAEANINSNEALQGSNIMLQGDTAKNQLAEQYIATANEEGQRQQAFQYQQYMDGLNVERQNRSDNLMESQFNQSVRQNETSQQNYLAEIEYSKAQDEIQNALNEDQMTISQAQLALSQAKFNFDKSTYNSGGGSVSSSEPTGMTDEELRVKASGLAEDENGVFDPVLFKSIYSLLKSGSASAPPTLLTPTRSILLKGMNNLLPFNRRISTPKSTNTVAPLSNWGE